jgi:hypothetical protein
MLITREKNQNFFSKLICVIMGENGGLYGKSGAA